MKFVIFFLWIIGYFTAESLFEKRREAKQNRPKAF